MPGKQNGLPAPGENGKFHFDPDDPEYIKDLQRPAVIKEDMNEMERRKRVHQILDSKPFRKELEELIKTEKAVGNNAENLKTLEQLSELILPRGQIAAASLHGISSGAIVPIADIRGPDATKYERGEVVARCRLAALYRLIDLFQWSQGIYNHVTMRLGGSEEFLINPFGLLYHEVSASTLIKVDLKGNILDRGTTGMGINDAGFALHSAIHESRPEINCIIHLHTPVVGAVAAMKQGLLPICQEAMIVGPVSYHDFQGIVSEEEQKSIAADLKPDSKVMLLRNHGCVVVGETAAEAFHLAYHTVLACETQAVMVVGDGSFLVCGETLEEAFFLLRNLVTACENQIRAARAGLENLVIPDPEAQRKCMEKARQGGGGVLRSPSKEGSGKIAWRCGELEWEAWMRVLDNAGFRTGHNYRQPLLRGKMTSSTHQSDVEVPPTSSSYGELDEEVAASAAVQRLETMRREAEKTRWLASPNVYQKVEFLESGTAEPKKITKWIVDPTSPQHSTPVKISDLHQFSPIAGPQTTKEFKTKQKAIKERRRVGEISAGPQSHILDGATYEDMQQMSKDAEMSGATEGIGIMTIGTASKGIIDRNFQHNAQVYRQMYAPNPFASETDEDIAKYMSEVKAKSLPRDINTAGAKPASPTETESPNAETISLMQVAREHRRDSRNDNLTTIDEPMSTSVSKAYARETTFDVADTTPKTRFTERRTASSTGGLFGRSRSERPVKQKEKQPKNLSSTGPDRLATSDDEGKEKKKKKKKSLVPSFLRSKKKDTSV